MPPSFPLYISDVTSYDYSVYLTGFLARLKAIKLLNIWLLYCFNVDFNDFSGTWLLAIILN